MVLFDRDKDGTLYTSDEPRGPKEKSLFGSVETQKGTLVSEQDLRMISALARKEMKAEEVYTFPVVLCGNEIDRDSEYFTDKSLAKMAKLFVGVTGIFNHSWNSKDQVMRIYDVKTVTDGERITSYGVPYKTLHAMVYMPRLEKNADLIAEIDAGIKKEVSVSCRINKHTCSVCGAPYYGRDCDHFRGKEYDGKRCVVLLEDPADAYEFSFVAVPAQPDAGVTKSGEKNSHNKEADMTEKDLREQYSGLVEAIEKAAEERGRQAALTAQNEAEKAATQAAAETVVHAVTAERDRLKGIAEIAPAIGDDDLVKEAMFGEKPLTAEQLSYAAMKKNATLGTAVLKQMREAAEASGANGVGGAAVPPDETPQAEKSAEELAEETLALLNKAKGGEQ